MAAAAWQQAFGHSGRVFGLAFHPHSSDVLASAAEDETVRVWRATHAAAAEGDQPETGGGVTGWQQTSCCRGHTSEVLRLAWSPDGAMLASGSADHTVRLWQVSASAEQSYAGAELAVLGGHPEEVYAVHFLHGNSSNGTPSTAAAAAGGPAAASARSSLLLSASGDSLYLWDLAAGQLLQQSRPLPAMRMSRPQAGGGSSGGASQQPQQQQQQRNAGAKHGSATAAAVRQQQQGSKQQDAAAAASASDSEPDSGPGGTDDSASEQEEEEEEEDAAASSYIFSVAVAGGGSTCVAASCSDGMLRVWDASRRALQEIGAVLVHPGQMGSSVSFVPGHALLLASISKAGACVLQDLRLLGRPLLSAQLQGPVYDATWLTADAAAVADASSTTSSSRDKVLWLVTAGSDSQLRCYPFTAGALQTGQLAAPHMVAMPGRYPGTLLAVAAAADGGRLAAAGEAVPVQQLQQPQVQLPSAPPRQQQAAAAVEGGASAAAAAAAAGAVRRRRSKAVAIDLLSMAEDSAGAPAEGPAAAGQAADAGAAAAAAAGVEHMAFSGAAACAAAAAGALLRAPLFVLDV